MLDQQTMSILHSLKLFGMARGLEERLADSNHASLSHAEFIGLLVQDEKIHRDNLRLRRLLKKAKLRQEASLEDIDYGVSRGLVRQIILELSNPQWITANRNVLISGPTGVGKSYIACALGNRACEFDFRVLSWRMPPLFHDLAVARADGSYRRILDRIKRADLLIVDDWGISTLTESERRDFLEIAEDRYETGSTIICSQIPVDNWHATIGEATLADSICDRLVHNAYRVNLSGESIRKMKGKSEIKKKKAAASRSTKKGK